MDFVTCITFAVKTLASKTYFKKYDPNSKLGWQDIVVMVADVILCHPSRSAPVQVFKFININTALISAISYAFMQAFYGLFAALALSLGYPSVSTSTHIKSSVVNFTLDEFR